MTTLRAGSATDVGRIRSANEDSKLVVSADDLYIVADGMGGHQGGEVASKMAVETIEDATGEASLEDLKEAVRKANRVIFEKAGNDPDLHGMGTTTVAIRVVPGPEGDEIAWINVGDSRIYLFRDDNLIQLSRDHSLVEDLLRDGQLTPEEAAVHPQRNILTRALGIDVDVDVDGGSVIPFEGDRFLLCSDGLFNEVSTDQMTSVLRRLADPSEAADELVRLANEGGGRDNITVVVVEVVDDDGRSAAASAALAGEASGLESHADEPVTTPADAGTEPPASEAPPAPAQPVVEPAPEAFAGYRSSLPASDDDYHAEKDDLFGDMDAARSKRFTWRVVAFVLALLLVAVVVAGAFIWSSSKTYYVGFKGDRVAVYKGKPGGVLFVDPKLQDTTDITRDELPQNLRAVLDDGKEVSSRAAATRYLVYLRTVAHDTATTTTTTTSTTTTTTKPKTTTTTAPIPTTTAHP
jgi:serine/threonine protein phosphatase PrpC